MRVDWSKREIWEAMDRQSKLKTIKDGINKGLSFNKIAAPFDLTGQTLKYYWRRYYVEPQQNPKDNDVYLNYIKELGKAGML